MPVFARQAGEDPQELEWMIFEVSRDYVRQQLLPDLVAKFLNPTGEEVFDAALIDANGNPIFGRKPAVSDARADLIPRQYHRPPRTWRGARGRRESGQTMDLAHLAQGRRFAR